MFRFTTYSVSFLGSNGTFATGTIPVNVEVSPVNDAPEIVPFEESLGVNNDPGVLPGYVQVPMGELLDTTYPNMGSVNVFGRDTDSTLLYVQMMSNFKYGVVYAVSAAPARGPPTPCTALRPIPTSFVLPISIRRSIPSPPPPPPPSTSDAVTRAPSGRKLQRRSTPEATGD